MKLRRFSTFSVCLACGAMLALANPSFGDENDNSRSDRTNNSGQKANQDRSQDQSRQDQDRSNDEDASHHAGLGVSLLEQDGHVNVIAVMPGSPAAKAGVRVGDEIRYVNDDRIRTAQALAEEISENRPGAQIELSIRRNGEKQTLKATLGSQEAFGGRQRDGRERSSYSYGSNDRQSDQTQQQLRQRLQDIQRQAAQLHQEISELQAALREPRNQGNQNESRARSNYPVQGATYYGPQGNYNGQQGSYQGQRGRMMDRTNENYSTSRGWSRDHGPRETDSGNVANED